jgi:photosystem II stability/assembly factor-like uncharacterized protein
MKFFLAPVFFVLAFPLMAQSWLLTDSLPRAGRYDDMYFIDDQRGWVVNSLGSIFKTVDGGDSWLEVLVGDTQEYMRTIEFISDSVGFAAPLETSFYATTDGGNTWNDIIDSIPGNFQGLCGMSHVGQHVFGVGVFNGPAYFIKSVDGGRTWTFRDMSEYADGLVECHFLDSLHGFVGGSRFGEAAVILETVDGGDSWSQVYEESGGFAFAWKIFFVDGQTAFASIEKTDCRFTIARTTDGGKSWQTLYGPEGCFDLQGIGFDSPWHGWVSPRTDSLYETFDGGETWQPTDALRNVNRFFQVPGGRMYASGSQIHYMDASTAVTSPVHHQYYHRIAANPNPAGASFELQVAIDISTDAIIGLVSGTGNQMTMIFRGNLAKGDHRFEVNETHLSPFGSQPVIAFLATDEGFLNTKVIRISR